MPDALPDDLREGLAASAGLRGPWGEPEVFVVETGSTNDVAVSMARRGATEGTMVVALAQHAGRDRLGREWFSPAGAGLYVSIVCRNAQAAPLLTLAGGVAVADGIRQATGLPVVLKWPNDVVVPDRLAPGRRRKLAGILAEGATGPDGIQYVVLGVGINVRPVAWPPDIAATATSIEAELGRPVDRGAVLGAILQHLNRHVTALAASNRQALLDRWRELSPSATGARIAWTAQGVACRGVTGGIDENGALLVKTPGGVERIIAGELTWL
jgi:BirA family biotin operon repressor/biotin-[acetyl-CoA-carboxylase] ligase